MPMVAWYMLSNESYMNRVISEVLPTTCRGSVGAIAPAAACDGLTALLPKEDESAPVVSRSLLKHRATLGEAHLNFFNGFEYEPTADCAMLSGVEAADWRTGEKGAGPPEAWEGCAHSDGACVWMSEEGRVQMRMRCLVTVTGRTGKLDAELDQSSGSTVLFAAGIITATLSSRHHFYGHLRWCLTHSATLD